MWSLRFLSVCHTKLCSNIMQCCFWKVMYRFVHVICTWEWCIWDIPQLPTIAPNFNTKTVTIVTYILWFTLNYAFLQYFYNFYNVNDTKLHWYYPVQAHPQIKEVLTTLAFKLWQIFTSWFICYTTLLHWNITVESNFC